MIDNISWLTIYPEIVLMVMGCIITLVDLGVSSKRRNGTYFLTLLTLAAVAIMQAMSASSAETAYGWGNMVVSDAMGNWLKCFAALAMMVALVYARPYSADRGMLERGGELFSLAIFSLLGIFVMIGSNHLLVLYLGLELLTLSSYAMVALRRDHETSVEAAMKYFVLGAMASGFLLYGMSMIYGATGTLNIGEIFAVLSSSESIASTSVGSKVLTFGVVFLVSGLAFKLGAVPFHMWIPDVYHGAPTSITLIIGSAPKLAAFAVVVRLLVEGLLPLAFDWQQMLALLAIASLLVGNLIGVAQSNLKRMLAYSTISHMGFLLLGLISGVVDGKLSPEAAQTAYGAAMFYVVTYVLTALPAFGIILLLARQGFESEEINDLAGLNQRSPLYAGVMTVCMFSLAGIPPLVGFYAKLAVLEALVATGQSFNIGLAVFAVVMSLIGAFYYLRVVKVMYFDKPSAALANINVTDAPLDVRSVLSANGLLVLVLGILPGGLMGLCADAIARAITTF